MGHAYIPTREKHFLEAGNIHSKIIVRCSLSLEDKHLLFPFVKFREPTRQQMANLERIIRYN